jgi:hypothetical protein
LKFAEPLKEMAQTLLFYLGIDDDRQWEMTEGSLKETPIPGLGDVTPRHLMVTLGTEWGRNCVSEDLWCDIAARRACEYIQTSDVVLFDDVRFPNEIEALRRTGYPVTTLRVVRTATGDIMATHPSETSLNDFEFDHVLTNDGTQGDLAQKVRELFRGLRRKKAH